MRFTHFVQIQYSVLTVGFFIGLTSCFGAHFPSSSAPGLFSTTTGQQTLADNSRYSGWPDDQVLRFDRNACVDSFHLQPLATSRAAEVSSVTKADQLPIGPGVVAVDNNGLCMDEAEIPNREWQHYVRAQTQAGAATAALQPLAAALPVPDYFTNRFYEYYPVVGISYEQAQVFCRWRSQALSQYYNRKLGEQPDTLAPDYVRVVYRLPTEAEWEHAALLESRLPFGTSCTQLPVTVSPQAAEYLRQRSGCAQSAAVVRADIVAYNATHPLRNRIIYAQEDPYFLRTTTPIYVYQGPPNAFGLYQLLGNVAELVQQKGVTKGGSYRDALIDCCIKARGHYNGPAPHIGFRTVFTLSYPNRL